MSEEEQGDGFLDLPKSTEIGIAAFFVSAPALAMLAEALRLGEAGLVVGAVGAAALGIAGKYLLDSSGPHLPVIARLREANWGALLLTLPDEQQEAERLTAQAVQEDESEPDQQECMHFGSKLHPHANSIFSGRKALFGVSDAGKSNNVAVIAEEIARFGAPLFLLDTEDEYRALCQKAYFPRPVWVDRERIGHTRAYDFAQWAMDRRAQVVINLQSYEDDEAAWLMIGLIKGIQAWEESHDRIPCELILDEATVWLPQHPSESNLSKIMVDDPDGSEESKQVSLLSLLQRAFFSIVVRRGRKRGMGFTLAAQRIAEIDKRALQASWLFLMKQTQPADWRLYKDFGIDAEDALALSQGEAFVQAPGAQLVRHQFRLRTSPHGAHAPGLAELRKPVTQPVSAVSRPETAENTRVNSPEMPHQADEATISTEQFPVSRLPENDAQPGVKQNHALVSRETREQIRRMKERGYPDREIAKLTRLAGRKYGIYRQVVRELGYPKETTPNS